MDPWEQKLKDSGIAELVINLEAKLDEYNGAELSIEDRGNLDRIRAANEQIHILVENSDPRIINYPSLAAVQSNLSNIINYLGSWDGGVSPAYLSTHAVAQVEELLRQAPLISASVNIPDAKAAITNLRRSAARQKTIVDKITDEIQAKGSLADETVDEKIVEAKTEINAEVATAKEKLADIDTEAEEIVTQLEDAKAAVNKLATEQNEVFNTAQTKRTKEFETLIKEQKDEAYGVFASISEKVTTEVDGVKDRAEHSADLADEARAKSEELLGIVSQNALINDYSKNGLHEQKWSRIWQIITLLSLIATVATGALLALNTDDGTSWQKLVARFGVLIATGGLAAYAASQASEHKQAQRQSEHLSLQLSAVRPYLADIDDKGERDKLLIKLAEKFFREKKAKEVKQASNKKRSEENNISGDDLPGLIGAIIGIVNAANKK